ncbi:MAG: glycosyltransferase family 4 protein [Gammaproteobacteria bacterium]|nr:glycosyltransferase family 4 protein [Gammaproteobacteria bacterium]
MNVLQVLPGLESGGVERGTLEIGQALVEAGHTSTVLSQGGSMVHELQQAGSRHICWNIGNKTPLNFFQVRKLRKWLVAQEFDIVHVRSRMPAWVVWLAWKKMDPQTRPKLVSTVHGLHSVNRYSEIMTCGERVIAVSEAVADYIQDSYPRTNSNKVELIYRGINPKEFPRGYQADKQWKEDWYRQYPDLKGAIVVTLPGRLTRLKGHLAFLKAIAALRAKGMRVYGLIVGGVDPKRKAYAEEVKKNAIDLGLSGFVFFTGQRRDIRDIYSVSDLVLSLSSKPESFGRTVLEALSMGVPVLGYDHGGVREILSYLFPSGLTPLGDENALIEKMEALLLTPEAAIKPNDRFLLATMKSKTLALYQSMLA